VLLQTVQLDGVYLGLGDGVPAGLSSLILSASPLIVAAAGVPLFAEHLTGRQWIGLGLGLVGVLVSLSEKLSGSGQAARYAFTGLVVIGFAAGTLYQKRFGRSVDLRTGTTIQLLGATVTSFPLAAARGGPHIPPTTPVLGSLVRLATVNSIGSFGLLQQRPGGAATSLLYLVPPVTALLAVVLLGQAVTSSVFLGMAISGAGVVLVVTGPALRSGTRVGFRVRGVAGAGYADRCEPAQESPSARGARG
jgi:drug/metabolite transporter (DMT)-like permease